MKTVIFDMDGLLVDSEIRAIKAWREVAEEYNIPNIEELFPYMMGTNPETRKGIFEKRYGTGFNFYECNEKVRDLAHQYEEETPIPLKAGVKDILAYLHKNGYRIGLASSGKRETIEKRMKNHGIWHYFDAVVSGEMVKISKPNPEIFLLCAEKLGSSPSECTVLEDSPNGITAAHAAGMRAIMVPDLYQPKENIAAMAYAVYPSLVDVKEAYERGKL